MSHRSSCTRIRPGRTAYVEWANEVWNFGWGFEASAWVVEQIAANMGGSFDTIALAPYITFTHEQRVGYTAATTVDRILADARTNVATSLQWTRRVRVKGDRSREADETFRVVLSSPVNARLSTTAATATGTIVNDDGRLRSAVFATLVAPPTTTKRRR